MSSPLSPWHCQQTAMIPGEEPTENTLKSKPRSCEKGILQTCLSRVSCRHGLILCIFEPRTVESVRCVSPVSSVRCVLSVACAGKTCYSCKTLPPHSSCHHVPYISHRPAVGPATAARVDSAHYTGDCTWVWPVRVAGKRANIDFLCLTTGSSTCTTGTVVCTHAGRQVGYMTCSAIVRQVL